MRPEDALRAINEARGEALVVPTMTAVPAWRTIAPDAPSVACVGFMGGASSLGLGLALAQPARRVIVLDGDGSLLMQLGSLATVAGAAPVNFTHFLFANGVYQTSGSQAIPSSGAVDFAGMASAAGYAQSERIETLEELRIRLPELLSARGPAGGAGGGGSGTDADDGARRGAAAGAGARATGAARLGGVGVGVGVSARTPCSVNACKLIWRRSSTPKEYGMPLLSDLMTLRLRPSRLHIVGLALLAVLAVAFVSACGDDDDGDAPASTPAAADATAAATEAPATAEAEDSTVSDLQANASGFEYRSGTYGGTVRFTTISEPLTFNLAIATDASSAGVLGYLFEGLTEISWLTNEVEPGLAESWENSSDGLAWTFRLREDVSWHDGEPFTAADVAFTFNQIIYNDEIESSDRASFTFRFLDEAGEWQTAPMTVEVIDDYTVRFVLPTPFAPFLRAMGVAIYPKHLLEQAVVDGVFGETWGLETPPQEIVGTGPFTIESYEPEAGLVLRRNANYWLSDAEGNQLPYLDAIEMTFVATIEDELAAFRAGESDTYGVPGREYTLLEPLQEEENFTIFRRGPSSARPS